MSLQAFENRMTIKVRYLHSHLDEFPENLGEVSEDQGECSIKTRRERKRYEGRWNALMIADDCWSLMRDISDVVHKKPAKKGDSYRTNFTSIHALFVPFIRFAFFTFQSYIFSDCTCTDFPSFVLTIIFFFSNCHMV